MSDETTETAVPKPWTLEERLRAVRGYLERVKAGEEDLPRSGSWVALDHLNEIEKLGIRYRQALEQIIEEVPKQPSIDGGGEAMEIAEKALNG